MRLKMETKGNKNFCARDEIKTPAVESAPDEDLKKVIPELRAGLLKIKEIEKSFSKFERTSGKDSELRSLCKEVISEYRAEEERIKREAISEYKEKERWETVRRSLVDRQTTEKDNNPIPKRKRPYDSFLNFLEWMMVILFVSALTTLLVCLIRQSINYILIAIFSGCLFIVILVYFFANCQKEAYEDCRRIY